MLLSPYFPLSTLVAVTFLEQYRFRHSLQKLYESALCRLSNRPSLNDLCFSWIASLIACLYRYLHFNLSEFISPLRCLPVFFQTSVMSMHCCLRVSRSGDHQGFCNPTRMLGTHCWPELSKQPITCGWQVKLRFLVKTVVTCKLHAIIACNKLHM